MKLNYTVFKTFFKNKRAYSAIVIIVIDIAIIVFLVFFGLNLRKKYTEMLATQDEVQQLRATITLIRNNRKLFGSNLDSYNQTLEQLIPDQESYFIVISALEQLAVNTGVSINSYSINLDSTTEEKLTLAVNIEGGPESIRYLLQNYKYAGGRLITTESINIDPEKLESMQFSMNFYHNDYRDVVSPESRVTQEDIDRIEEIQSQLP